MVQGQRTPTASREEPLTFRMKQFSIRQERSALRVGTDGVMLGAYVGRACPDALSILDVGTGTGVIALMLAQSLPLAHIDGIEIDRESVEEARFNVAASPFRDRVHIHHGDYSAFSSNQPPYDLIVSNPPFFTSTHHTKDARSTTAKHISGLTPSIFFGKCAMLLGEEGIVALITAMSSLGDFVRGAEEYGFHVCRILYIRTVPHKSPKRVILFFSRHAPGSACPLSSLTIQTGGHRHAYTEEYSRLLSPFLTIFP